MIKSNLIRVLQTFNKKELRDFKKWLQSPSHNQREDVIILLGYLGEDNRLGQEDKLEKKLVFSHLFPNETYSDAKMRQVMYFLMQNVEQFLIFEEVSKNEILVKTTLARVYRKRKLGKSFEKNLKTASQLLEESDFRNEDYLRSDFELKTEKYKFLSEFKRSDFGYQQVSNALDVEYLANKLKASCIMFTHQRVYKTEYEIGLFDEVVNYVEKKQLFEVPAIAMYYYSYKSIVENTLTEHFWNLKDEITKSGHLFPKEEIRNIYVIALNFCIGQINAGNKAFIKETFALYKKGIAEDLFVFDGYLSRFTYKNIVSAGLNLSEYEWVFNFIEEYKDRLRKEYRESNYKYNLAKFYYATNEYEKALQFLIQVDYDDLFMNLDAKNMLMKIYYELEEFTALDSLLESFKTFIRRKKVIGYHKSNYQNIIKYINKILKVNPYSKKEKEALKMLIQETNPLTEKEWLLTQLQKLN